MLLPDKHITLAESILGLGSFVLGELSRPKSLDQLYSSLERANETTDLPAYHGVESLILAILFLYSIDAIDLTRDGRIRQCAS